MLDTFYLQDEIIRNAVDKFDYHLKTIFREVFQRNGVHDSCHQGDVNSLLGDIEKFITCENSYHNDQKYSKFFFKLSNGGRREVLLIRWPAPYDLGDIVKRPGGSVIIESELFSYKIY